MIFTIGKVQVSRQDGVFRWSSGLSVDADGAPNCYSPLGFGKPLDYLENAGHHGNWYGIVTDTGEPDGGPVIQLATDPNPGYYISTTALGDHRKHRNDPTRYVDANTVPYISVPPELEKLGVRMGDVCYVAYGGLGSAAVVADVGPKGKIGEGSCALATALGLIADPRSKQAGAAADVRYTVFSGTRMGSGWPRDNDSIVAQVAGLMGDKGDALV